MRKYVKQSLALTLAFFFFGFGYGLWDSKKEIKEMANATPLRVLCGEGWISDSLIQRFAIEHKTPIQHFTYARPGEMLRQLANADGKIDVICTSSLLLRGLVHSKWIRKIDSSKLSNKRHLAVDFSNLPYDSKSEYSVPLFWNLYGVFGKNVPADVGNFKDIWTAKKLAVWGEDLNLFQLLNTVSPLHVEKQQQGDEDIRSFARNAASIIKPSPNGGPLVEAAIAKGEWLQAPLARVARFLSKDSGYTFRLPEDGAAIEVGVLAVGENSEQPELALQLIDEMISSEEALATHKRLGTGLVHASLNDHSGLSAMEKAQAVRDFPLTRFKFPDLDLEALPHFQKVMDELSGGTSLRN